MKLRRLSRRWIFLSLRTIGRTVARGGHERLSYWGDRLGRWHYALRPMFTQRLAKDLRVLGSLMNAESLMGNTNGILRSAFQTNDRAVLELMALYGCVDDPKPLVPPAHIHQIQRIKEPSFLGCTWEMGYRWLCRSMIKSRPFMLSIENPIR
jgi:hypothetical protein